MKTGTKLGLLSLAMALSCVAVWAYLTRQVSLPENRILFVIVFIAALATAISSFVVKGRSWLGGLAAVPAMFISLLLTWTIGISEQVTIEEAIAVGDTIPHFTAIDGNDQPFDSDSLQGRLLLIKFFRAHW
jgi:hypothetical protein